MESTTVGLSCAYLLAALIGALAGSVELLGRYRDDPFAAVREPAALLYIGFNACASLLAFYLVQVFDVRFGLGTDNAKRLMTTQVLVAGLSAVAFFRTTLFTVRVSDASLPIGPSLILQVLLSVTDRAVDRGRAIPRAKDMPAIMQNIDFAKAEQALPAFCFGVMQNMTADEQTAARTQIDILAKTVLSNALKCNLLGLLLVNLVGRGVLESAVA